MGGYGGYVWAAFGFTLLAMLGLAGLSWRAQRRRNDELALLRSTVRPRSERPARRLIAVRAEPATSGGGPLPATPRPGGS